MTTAAHSHLHSRAVLSDWIMSVSVTSKTPTPPRGLQGGGRTYLIITFHFQYLQEYLWAERNRKLTLNPLKGIHSFRITWNYVVLYMELLCLKYFEIETSLPIAPDALKVYKKEQ